jgi:hypothetical protein
MISGLVKTRVCRGCGIEKDMEDFLVRYDYKGRSSLYRYVLTCNDCKPNISKHKCKELFNPKIERDIKYFIKKIELRGGHIDEVDAFRLVNFYVYKFGIKYYEKLSIEDELCLMWEELKGVYNASALNASLLFQS